MQIDQTQVQARKLSYYMFGCLGTGICCFGVLANALSVVVLSKKSMRNTSTNLYLMALAVADTMVLLMSVLVFLKDTRDQFDAAEYAIWRDFPQLPVIYIYSHALNLLFQVASVWLTVAFTADRYVMICHPFVAERYCSRRLVLCIIACVFAGAAVYSVPRLFEQETIEPEHLKNFTARHLRQMEAALDDWEAEAADSANDTTQFPLGYSRQHLDQLRFFIRLGSFKWYHTSEFGKSGSFRVIYHLTAWLLLVVAAPFLSIAVMNAFLIREVRRSRSRGRRINATDRRRSDTNLMLIGVVCLFFVCQIPAAVSHVLWSTKSLDDRQALIDLPAFAFHEVSNLLVVLNSAINIVPYYLFSRRFRREFARLLACTDECRKRVDARMPLAEMPRTSRDLGRREATSMRRKHRESQRSLPFNYY